MEEENEKRRRGGGRTEEEGRREEDKNGRERERERKKRRGEERRGCGVGVGVGVGFGCQIGIRRVECRHGRSLVSSLLVSPFAFRTTRPVGPFARSTRVGLSDGDGPPPVSERATLPGRTSARREEGRTRGEERSRDRERRIVADAAEAALAVARADRLGSGWLAAAAGSHPVQGDRDGGGTSNLRPSRACCCWCVRSVECDRQAADGGARRTCGGDDVCRRRPPSSAGRENANAR